MQTKLGSFLESIINILIGAGIAFLAQMLIFPLFDIHISYGTNAWITFWFTWISILRSYCVRRWFNAYIERVASRFDKEPETRWEPEELVSWTVKGQDEIADLKPEPAEEARVKFEHILWDCITEPYIKKLYIWNTDLNPSERSEVCGTYTGHLLTGGKK